MCQTVGSRCNRNDLHDKDLIDAKIPVVYLPATLVALQRDPGDWPRAIVVSCNGTGTNDRRDEREEQGREDRYMHVDCLSRTSIEEVVR